MKDRTDEKLRALEAWLQRLYKDAESEMRGKWDKYLSRQQERAETLLSRVREAETDEERAAAKKAYQAFLKSKTAGDKHYREMVRELAREYSRTTERALEIINGKRAEFFADGYNFSADAINHAAIREDIGIRFDLCDADAVAELAKRRNDMNFPTPKYLEVTKDTLWNIKNINSQVAQGIVQGESIQKIAARIQNVTGVNTASAVRTARTVAIGSHNAGRQYSLNTAEELGIKTRKQWHSTHDGRTRDTHNEPPPNGVSEEIVENDQTFSNGCRWPGDPVGPASEVWNCRCRMDPVIDGFSPLLPKGKENAIHVWIDGEKVR